MKEEFKAWVKSTGFYEHTWGGMECGWDARQPEIDALKAENEQLRNKAASAEKWKGVASAKFGDGRTVQKIEEEAIDAFKAENERLRADAERWQWARQNPHRIQGISMHHDWQGSKYVSWHLKPQEMDATLDAAMSALPDTKGE